MDKRGLQKVVFVSELGVQVEKNDLLHGMKVFLMSFPIFLKHL